jgi:HSP20 family protein
MALFKKKKKETDIKKREENQDWLQAEGELAIDVYQTKSDFIVQAPVAGVKPEELDVYTENGMLVIKGERKNIEEKEEKDYFYQECYWGSFSRKVSLPEDVDSSKIKASLKKGILTIEIPKKKTKKNVKKIDIEEEKKD